MKSKHWLKFQHNEYGFGRLEIFKGTKLLFSYNVRTGAKHDRDGDGKVELVNNIRPGTWWMIAAPVKTNEKGMCIKREQGFGWKIRLYLLDERGKYVYTHYLIHPDGGVPGTLGCVGLQETNAPELFGYFTDIWSKEIKPIIPVLINEPHDYYNLNQKEKPVKKLIKSRTFWGGLIFALAMYLETQGVIPGTILKAAEIVGISLGLLGARNVNK